MLITRSQLQPVRRQTPHGGKQMANKMLQQSWHDMVCELLCNSRFLLRPAQCWTASFESQRLPEQADQQCRQENVQARPTAITFIDWS